MDCIFVFIKIFNEFLDSAFIVIGFTFFLAFSFILEDNLDTLVQESHLSETVLESIIIKYGSFCKDLRIRPESSLGTCLLGFSYYFQLGYCLTFFVALLINIAVSFYFNLHVCGKGIYNRSTYSVKTA